jgi:hypothetical protein
MIDQKMGLWFDLLQASTLFCDRFKGVKGPKQLVDSTEQLLAWAGRWLVHRGLLKIENPECCWSCSRMK